MIVGITGLNCSGKSTACKFLKDLGFQSISLSDYIRKECHRRGLESSRNNMIWVGNEIRTNFGSAELTRRAVKDFKKENIVVDSIRNIHELAEFKKLENFLLLSIDSPIEIRYQRSLLRNRIEDVDTLDEFRAKEKEEMSDNENAQQLHKIIEDADYIIINDSEMNELMENIRNVLEL